MTMFPRAFISSFTTKCVSQRQPLKDVGPVPELKFLPYQITCFGWPLFAAGKVFAAKLAKCLTALNRQILCHRLGSGMNVQFLINILQVAMDGFWL